MAGKEFGRLDYMKHLKTWKVIGYVGQRDVELARIADKQSAWDFLRNWYYTNKSGRR